MIGIIDADLLDNKTHFPNLALMKISAYWKSQGKEVYLINWKDYNNYEQVYVSKIFDYTKTNDIVLNKPNIIYGGTGFYFDQAKFLPNKIEHMMPDYNLYSRIDKKYKYHHHASIGFTTRGCFRHCKFCVNRNYDNVQKWSDIDEFYSEKRKFISLLDDNILGYSDRINTIQSVVDKNTPFEFNQGMDIRLMSEDVRDLIQSSKYHGDYIFAFDDWDNRKQIIKKLELWLSGNPHKTTKLYLLVGFKDNGINDIIECFKRIRVLMYFKCIPYIMRYSGWDNGDMRGMYINIARWCNQPSFFKKTTFREFVNKHPENSSTVRYVDEFISKYPKIADEFFDIRYGEVNDLYI